MTRASGIQLHGGWAVMLSLALATFPSHADTLSYGYDANGNRISGDGQYYEYNDANRLARIRQGNASGSFIAEFFYDHTGQRIKKIENGVTTYYIGKHFEVNQAGYGTVNTNYYFAGTERVAKTNISNGASTSFFYHSNHLGSTEAISDANGNLVNRTNYFPFGEIRQGGVEKYSFTGKERDVVSGQYYFEARYYDSPIKHFTQADSIVPYIYDPQSINRYSFVRNNPLKYVDPTGHFFKEFKEKFSNFADKYADLATHVLTKIAAEASNAPNWKVVNVSGYINPRSGKWVDAYSRRAPNAVKSGAIHIGKILGPAVQTASDWSRDDLRGGQKLGRASVSILESVTPIGYVTLGAELVFGAEKVDQAKADIFSDKNPVIDKSADLMRSIGGEKFDQWLLKQDWLDAF